MYPSHTLDRRSSPAQSGLAFSDDDDARHDPAPRGGGDPPPSRRELRRPLDRQAALATAPPCGGGERRAGDEVEFRRRVLQSKNKLDGVEVSKPRLLGQLTAVTDAMLAALALAQTRASVRGDGG